MPRLQFLSNAGRSAQLFLAQYIRQGTAEQRTCSSDGAMAAIRWLAAQHWLRHAPEDPDRLSFLHAVRVVRRKLPLLAAFPPSGQVCPA